MKTIERIFMIMKEKNIKDKPIYTAAKVPKNTFGGWRKSLKNPDPDTLPEIAKVLGVSLEWLITGTEKISDSAPDLPEDEQQLLQHYNHCNQEGKNRIMEQAEFIASKYPQQGKSSEYKIG